MSTIAPPAGLPAMIEHWVDVGIITPDQAESIRTDAAVLTAADTASPAGPPAITTPAGPPAITTPAGPPAVTTPAAARSRATSLVTEAMGYLGGVLIVVASALVTSRFWDELGTTGQLALTGALTVLLLLAGGAVPGERAGAGERLRAVLWLAASATLFALLTLAAADSFGWEGDAVTTFAAAGTAIASAGLWAAHRHVLQQVALLVSVVVTAGSGTNSLGGPDMLPGVAVWGVGTVWALLAWGGLLTPRRPGLILGSVAAVFASMTLAGTGWGSALALFTVVALVLLAVIMRDLVLLGVASFGTLFVLPRMMAQFFPGVLAAALALLAVGLLLVAAAVFTARRRAAQPAGPAGSNVPAGRDWSTGTPRTALTAAVAVAAATTGAVLIAGLL